MEELDYKKDIIQTRTGNVGSSDAKMLQQIAELGCVPKSAYKRLAVVKGIVENQDVTTPAMRFGDYIENQVFANLKASDERWQSNPCVFSIRYARKNVGCLTHIDYLLQDDERKILTVGECKATKLTFDQARNEYKYQLCHHYLLAKEIAKSLGDYSVRIMFCVYDTNGLDYSENEFDTSRLTVKQLRSIDKEARMYRLSDAMDIVNNFLETFTEYYEQEEIDANLLPVNVQSQFIEVAQFLREIKERETKVDAFKAKLYDFLSERGIKKVACDDFSFTVVSPTQQVSIDYKNLFTQEIEAKKPRIARKLKEKYKKTTNKKGYVIIKTNDNNK